MKVRLTFIQNSFLNIYIKRKWGLGESNNGILSRYFFKTPNIVKNVLECLQMMSLKIIWESDEELQWCVDGAADMG